MSLGSYDHFKFVQQWPPAVCDTSGCNRSGLSRFTIHGLWPNNKTYVKNQPTCLTNQTNSFKAAILTNSNLVSKLSTSWPDVKNANDNFFWKKQWDKHGTCSLQTYDQAQYFERSYNMWKETNLTNTLDSLIKQTPRQQNVTDIEQLIQGVTATEKKPLLRCEQSHSNASKSLLKEIVICYAHNGITVIDCVSQPKSTFECYDGFWFP
ncbi:ribonuclease MC-like [Rosa rugosa]|uniref:ribonuclease MC-like n=1 Tax=Rosa rugosa TaxID=74645 RepID=UPI002B40D391|nr:ribonuclease MC-like [Rosa rugosa]